MRTYTLKIFLIHIVMLCFIFYPKAVNSQAMDYENNNNTSYTIAVLPIKDRIYGIYNDNLNFVANELTNQLRKINGVHALNVLNSLRKLKPRQYERRLTSIAKNYNASDFPDPDDLSVVAQVLDADKIILVSGGFNTENGMLRKKVLAYDPIWIVPKYEYTAFATMFDPFTGNLEWQETFQTKFAVKDAMLPSINMSSNPLFYKKFQHFADKVALNITESLQKHFYTTETSTVDVKIIKRKPEATDGDLTTDGQPLSPTTTLLGDPSMNRPAVLPETEVEAPVKTQPAPVDKEEISTTEKNTEKQPQPVTNDHSLNTPYNETKDNVTTNPKKSFDIKDFKPDYEQELLNDYQNKMKSKY